MPDMESHLVIPIPSASLDLFHEIGVTKQKEIGNCIAIFLFFLIQETHPGSQGIQDSFAQLLLSISSE